MNSGSDSQGSYGKINSTPSVSDETTSSEVTTTWKARHYAVLFLMCSGNLFIQMALSILAAFYPDEATRKGASQTEIGFLFSVFEFGIVLVSPIFGKLLPQIGLKFGFVTGLLCAGFISASYGVLHYCPNGIVYVAMCFLLRIFDSLFAALFLTAAYSIIPLEFPASVASVTGAVELSQGLGFTIGPPFGGFLFQVGGIIVPFAAQGGILLVIGVISLIFLPSYSQESDGEEASVMTFIRIPSVWVTGAAVFSAAAAISCTEPTLEKRLDDFSLTPVQNGLMFLIMSAFYALPAPILGKFSDKLGVSHSMVTFGLFFSAVSACFLGPLPFFKSKSWNHSLWLTGVSLGFFGFSTAVAIVPTYDMLVNAALKNGMEENSGTYGIVAGYFMSIYSLGAGVGPLYGGLVMEYYKFSWVMFVTAVLLALATLVLLMYSFYVRCSSRENSSNEEARPLLSETLQSPVTSS